MDERKKERQWYLETQLDVMGRREDEMTYNATLKPGAPGSGAVAVPIAGEWRKQQQALKLRLNSILQLISHPVPQDKKQMIGIPREKVQVIYDEIVNLWRDAIYYADSNGDIFDIVTTFHLDIGDRTHFSESRLPYTDLLPKYTLVREDYAAFYSSAAGTPMVGPRAIDCAKVNYTRWVADKILKPLIEKTEPTELSKIYAGWPDKPSTLEAEPRKLKALYREFRLWHNKNSQMLKGLEIRLDIAQDYLDKCKTSNLIPAFKVVDAISVPLSVQEINRNNSAPLATQKQTQGLRARLMGGSIKRKNNKSKRRKKRKYKKTKRKVNSRRRTRNKLKR